MTAQVTWHGTQKEGFEALNALSRNCECEFTMGVKVTTCPAHDAFAHDQRWADGLVWMRRERERLLREEWCA
jgi:hypothetical protein